MWVEGGDYMFHVLLLCICIPHINLWYPKEEQNALQSLTVVTTNVIRSHDHVMDHRISLLVVLIFVSILSPIYFFVPLHTKCVLPFKIYVHAMACTCHCVSLGTYLD